VIRHGMDREGFAALLPLRAGDEDDMRRALEELPDGGASPFAMVPGTHFARVTLVPGLRGRDDRSLADVPFCVLFGAEFDAFPGAYLEMVCRSMPEAADELFGRCLGYPGTGAPGAFARWMLAHRVRPGFSVHGNPGATAGEVVRSLRLRERLIAFAVDAGGLGPDELRARFAEEDWDAEP
jgi:hypothetical protein